MRIKAYGDSSFAFCLLRRVLLGLCILSLSVPGHSRNKTTGAVKSGDARAGIWAELQGTLNASHVKPGDTLLAKVVYDWQTKECHLPKGAILKGHVEESLLRSATSKVSEVALNFEGECGGGTTLPLTLIAVLRPGNGHEARNSAVEAIPMLLSGGGRSISARAAMASTVTTEGHDEMPTSVKIGEVWGISLLKLSVASGLHQSSVLSISTRSLHLDFATNFVFYPHAVGPVADSSGHGQPPGGTTPGIEGVLPPPPFVDETEVCAPPTCSIALAENPSSGSANRSATSFSIAALGYSPRVTRELGALDHDAAIAYLGDNELLITFNPHRLIQRSKDDRDNVARIIRAVVIDLTTKKVKHTVDWRVPDAGQYLWPLSRNRVIAHIGLELRVYGPGLKLEQKMPLEGPLSFLTASPSGRILAVGIVRERHAWQIHRQLQEDTSSEPEEDVAVHLVDDSFKPIATIMRLSTSPTPVLTEAGEARAVPKGPNVYRIEESSWDQHTRKIAELGSSCGLRASALRSNLLYLQGCDRNTGHRWFRAVRTDGHAVLKGSSLSSDLDDVALPNEAGNAFAVGVINFSTEFRSGQPFHGTDLVSESITVYGSTDGKRIFNVSFASPAPTRQTFAFSPDGNQLAALQGNEILIYEIPQTKQEARNAIASPAE